MNVALWVLQIILALVYLAHGLMATVQPASRREELAALPYSSGFLRFIGICEILGALGLILPMWTGNAPWLTPLAAIGLALIMAGAVWTHLTRRETPQLIVTSLLFLLLAFIAYGRWTLFDSLL